jgi:hypothetical protein
MMLILPGAEEKSVGGELNKRRKVFSFDPSMER